MRRLLTAAAIAGCVVVELWRSGLAAPLLWGGRRWLAARPDPRYTEPDVLA